MTAPITASLAPSDCSVAGAASRFMATAVASISIWAISSVAVLSSISRYFVVGPREDRLRQNSPAIVRYPAPVLVVQDREDDVVPPKLTRDFANKSCRAGNTLEYLQVDGGAHTEVATRSADATVQWIADRFDAKAAPSSCDAQAGALALP